MKCKKCNGEMKLIDFESVCVGGDGYNTPYEYKVYEQWKCNECNNEESETYII